MRKNENSAVVVLSLVLAASAVTGCTGPAKAAKATPAMNPAPAEKLTTSKPTENAANKESDKPVLAGKVVEVINVQSYTYLLVEKDGNRGWAAVPSVEVKVGDEVELIPGIDMGKFSSATLKRTFANIHFSSGLKKGGTGPESAALPPGHPALPQAAPSLPPGHAKVAPPAAAPPEAPATKFITGKVVETANAGGYTYVLLEKDGGKTWAAIPASKVTVGSELSILPGNEISDFNSPSLKRTFAKIIFSPGVAGK